MEPNNIVKRIPDHPHNFLNWTEKGTAKTLFIMPFLSPGLNKMPFSFHFVFRVIKTAIPQNKGYIHLYLMSTIINPKNCQ